MTALNVKALLYKILSTPLMIDSGTDDIWHYRKWSDGTAECWALQANSVAMTNSYVGTNNYYAQTSESLPYGLFKDGTQPVVTMTRQGQDTSGLITISIYSVSNTQIGYYIINHGTPYTANIGRAIHAYGVWK